MLNEIFITALMTSPLHIDSAFPEMELILPSLDVFAHPLNLGRGVTFLLIG